MLVLTFFLYGGLNQMIFLFRCFLLLAVSIFALYLSLCLYPDLSKASWYGIKKSLKISSEKKSIRQNLFQIYATETYSKFVPQKMRDYYSLLCLQPLQRNLHLPSTTQGLLSSPSTTANLHTFTLIRTSIEKVKFTTHSTYAVNIRRFYSRSNPYN